MPVGQSQEGCVGPSRGDPAGDPVPQPGGQQLGDTGAALGLRNISGGSWRLGQGVSP